MLLLLAGLGFAADGALAVVPFGVAHFVWHKPVAGLVYAALEGGGVAMAGVSAFNYDVATTNGDSAGQDTWQAVTAVSIGTAALVYAVQLVDGSRLAELREQEEQAALHRRDGVLRFDAALALAHEPPP